MTTKKIAGCFLIVEAVLFVAAAGWLLLESENKK